MSLALRAYHKLPPPYRSIVASLRGYYLNWWRYDKQTEQLVNEALERDFWSEKDWADWREDRLSKTLERAAFRVPFYREMWAKRRRAGDTAIWEDLENWPVLEKHDLRQDSRRFVADDHSISKMYHEHTSGTTGTSLDLWVSGNVLKQWYALFDARCRQWYGLSRRDRWAILGGQLIVSAQQKRPPFWVWNAGMNQLYMSAYHLAPQAIGAYLDALAKYRIKYILGYPSAIYAIAVEAIKRKRTVPMDVVITNAEPLYDYQRAAISAAFLSPVRETYGMAEMAAAASECEKGNMHQWPEAGIIQTEGDSINGDSQEFICTGLLNADMPLIRYRVGDLGKISEGSCGCGRNLPLLEKIEGRSDDVLFTIDGKRIGRLDPIFKSRLPIVEAQIVQHAFTDVVIKYVPAEGFDKRVLNSLTERLRERMGAVDVSFEELSEIPRTKNGKFRAVICNIPQEQRPGMDGDW